MSTRHLILAWVKKHPSHGYLIKRCYQEFINPDEKLNDAKLYPLLKQMEEEGLITRETEDTDSGPSRKVITITPDGERVFREWLESEADERHDGPRYDFFRAFPFLVKFSQIFDLEADEVLAKVRSHLETHREKLEDYRGARKRMLEKGLEECKIQTIDFGIMLEETTVRWLEKMERHYRGGASPGRPSSGG